MSLTRSRPSIELLFRRRRNGGAAEYGDGSHEDSGTPIDLTCWFVCPTSTPLYYAPVYDALSEEQRLRYNQLTAMSFNELIAFFERTFLLTIKALLARAGRDGPGEAMARCLREFIEDEDSHIGWWRQLNCLSDAARYSREGDTIVRVSAVGRRALSFASSRPGLLPVVYWLMLALEERSLDISRRTLRTALRIEPRYRSIYRAHLRDETRHVQIDQHLIDRFYESSPGWLRQVSARLLRMMIGRYLLPPSRTAVRVVDRLVAEFPVLSGLRERIVGQLQSLAQEPAYHQMMFSRSSTPMLFAQFDRYEEMHGIAGVLKMYEPMGKGA